MNARVKLIICLVLILFIGLSPFKAWPEYILFLTLTLSGVVISRLGIGVILKRSLLGLPFVLAAAPLVFTGPAPYSVIHLLRWPVLQISQEGCLRFLSISLKAWVSLQAAILLAATTRFPDLLAAFRELKVPKLLVAVISLMWRYLSVIVDEVTRMVRARASRSTVLTSSQRAGGSILWRANVTGGMAGSLFLRSLERSERVYTAMLSRGYTGDLPPAEATQLSSRDRLILVAALGAIVFIWLLGLLTRG